MQQSEVWLSAAADLVFDARSAVASRHSGWERYSRSLRSALHDQFRVVDYVGPRWRGEPILPAANVVQPSIVVRGHAGTPVHYPTFPPPPAVSLALGRRLVYTLHDLTWWKYPETASRLGRAVYRKWAETAVRCTTILTVSEAVAREVQSSFGVPADRLFVASLASDLPICEPGRRPARDRPYLLSVAAIEPRKNIDRLVEAFRISGLAESHDLVLVGRRAWGEMPAGTSLLSDVDDDMLAGLYAGASATVLVSLYEGFGLPILESLAQGTTVVCSDLDVFREVSDGAGIFVDPLDPASIARGLRAAAAGGSPPTSAVLAARARSWADTARQAGAAYASARRNG
ncbi:glycosyltransferase family 4 protein [Geodermatophilus obscurus]|uniref:Glycosyl transferase group 1 n=1 Tax=Geodermatophilus obscurus (strain ATCC 25078 / DSM 43160 / JCM 3152 / CCUG 61914 / KCC A-0152 / KCTC 9177 / NBRC 13315 / NRRL B-3577 / G-20) TaxID=526225 RepID=D2S538_GEOOG|nr:glycosyl transferase group 1 [Geodermatophilus obscurus DSM 43160]